MEGEFDLPLPPPLGAAYPWSFATEGAGRENRKAQGNFP